MGNILSSSSDLEQPASFSSTRLAAPGTGMLSGREHEQLAPPSDAPKIARFIAPQSSPPSRIMVDIRGANLAKNYKVYICQEPQRNIDIATAWSGLQALGGLCITLLTIQKIWEDIRFIRILRRELSKLSTLAGSLTDDDGNAISKPARSRRDTSSTSSSSLGPVASHMEQQLNELSDLLGAPEGRTARRVSGADADIGGGAKQGQQLSIMQTSGAGAVRKETTWASISGLTEVKILLQEATVLPTLRPDLFQGVRQPPKALLLFGPPGNGKTLLARAVATESRATFLPVTGSSVLSMWYGQSEQNVKVLFEKARKKQPAIIFIDEVDSLLGKRDSGSQGNSKPDKRVTNEFLAFIDGIQTQQGGGSGPGEMGDSRIVVIAATNTPWDLDEAALSRFSRRIFVPLPNKVTREALMRRAVEGITCDVSDAEWQQLAEQCDKYSGRDLMQVCREAAMRPLRELWGRRLLEGSLQDTERGSGPATQQTAAAVQRLVEVVANSLKAAAAKLPSLSTTTTTAKPKANTTIAMTMSTTKASEPAQLQNEQKQSAGSCSSDGRAPTAAGVGLRGGRWAGWMRRLLFRMDSNGGHRYSRSKQQVRRELERWKRRHGASWCDVDVVMQQAEELVERMGAQGQAGDMAAVEVEATGAGPVEADPKSQPHEAAVEALGSAALGALDDEQVVRVEIQMQASVSTTGAEQDELRVRLQIGSGTITAAADTAEQERLKAVTATTGASATVVVAAATTTTSPADTTEAPVAGGGSVSRRSASGSGGGTRCSGGRGEGAAVDGPLGKGSGGSAVPALSLEELLTLPVDRVRSVRAVDLEAALQVISCTEMDQTARYTEWDEEYGSGATESGARSRSHKWMSMYA